MSDENLAPEAELEIAETDLDEVAGGATGKYMRINNDGKFYSQAKPSRI